MTLPLNKNPDPVYPENLLFDYHEGLTWYVARVKSRREKILADFLFRRGIGYYLPMVRKRQTSVKRVRYSLAPVFSGYVFIKTHQDNRIDILRSNHASHLIGVVDPDTFLHELKQIHCAFSLNRPVYPVDFLNVGRRVRVKKGPMKGVEGIIVRKDKKFRLVLSVTQILQSLSIEIDADMVEPI